MENEVIDKWEFGVKQCDVPPGMREPGHSGKRDYGQSM